MNDDRKRVLRRLNLCKISIDDARSDIKDNQELTCVLKYIDEVEDYIQIIKRIIKKNKEE